MKKNFISILITNYNKERFLHKSLRSILNQNYKNFEILLYDDCSTDNSLKVIKKFKKKVKLINRANNNKKRSGPLNQISGTLEAFRKSKGNIICLMDSDDRFLKNKLVDIDKFFKKNVNLNCVFNFPIAKKKQFMFKKRNKQYSVWPTIFPTSCISFRRSFFLNFIRHLKKNTFPYLEIDARITIFSKFFYNEYNLINKNLTFYSYDNLSINANIRRFSKLWWIRREQAYLYLKYIMKKKKLAFKSSFNYYITLFFSSMIKFFL